MPEWWESGDNVNQLARWLAGRDWFPNVGAVVDFFEAPYKYEHEWRHMEAEDFLTARPAHPPRQKRCELCDELNPEPEEPEE